MAAQRHPCGPLERPYDERCWPWFLRPTCPGIPPTIFNSGTQRLNRNNIDAKVNWNRNEKHQLWFKYSIMKALVTCEPSLGEAGGPGLCTGGGLGEGATQVQVATIGQTYTVSPKLPDRRTLGWTRFGQAVEPPDLGANFGSDVLGIPGTNGPDPLESGIAVFQHLRLHHVGQFGRLEPASAQRPVLHASTSTST